jgi:hypothetical protein
LIHCAREEKGQEQIKIPHMGECVTKNTKLPEYKSVNPRNHVKKNHPRSSRATHRYPIRAPRKKSF